MKKDLLQLIMDGMNWDKKKAQLWFNTPNPLLGGAKPNAFELLRGSKKLQKFIEIQLSENIPTYFPPNRKQGRKNEK